MDKGKDIPAKSKLQQLVEKAKSAGARIPDYVLDLLSIAFPRADMIFDAIKRLKEDDKVEPMLKADLLDCLNAMIQEEHEVTQRHVIDMRSDSWLAANIRPLTLAFLMINYVSMKWIQGYNGHVDMHRDQFLFFDQASIEGIEVMTKVAIEFYFGGRALLLISRQFGKGEGDVDRKPFWKRNRQAG